MYLTDISIESGFLFQSSTCSHTFEWYHHYFRRLLAVIWYFQGYCVSFKQALSVIPFFLGMVNLQAQSQPSILLVTLLKSNSTTHSFNFTVFLQNRNCSKEIAIIIIPPWFHQEYQSILGFRHAYIERSLFHDDIISSHPFFL